MRTGTVSYKVDDLRKSIIIPIGFVGENDFTRVIFDAEEIYKNYPAAQVSMKVQPPKGGIYPATVTKDGNNVIWQVKAADVAHRGSGELQMTFTEGDTVIKTYIARTDIKRSLAGNGPAPDPVQDWLDEAQEALEDIESAEVHQPIIGNDGYWYRWDAEAGEYVTTGTKAQGQDGHSPVLTSSKSGKTTTLYADGEQIAQIQDGEDGQGADVIDDTAGEGDTDKTWSADKLDEELTDVKTAIQGKYTLPSGGIPDTDLSSGVQTSLGLADTAYQKPSGGIPASDMAEGVIPTVPAIATSAQIKTGTDSTHPIAPIYQHESVFYAFAKLAGVDMAQSSNPVGQFTDSAKTAIQKMLGIYESPWELIREDTVTNATEADIEITVDGYGEALELTDIRMVFWLPKQDVQSAKGDYGRIFFYYDESNSDVAYLGAWQQAANASAKGGYAELVHDGNMIIKSYTANTTIGSSSNIQTLVSNEKDRGMHILTNRTYSKIVITAVTGTAKYRLFGRRKWN